MGQLRRAGEDRRKEGAIAVTRGSLKGEAKLVNTGKCSLVVLFELLKFSEFREVSASQSMSLRGCFEEHE